MTKVLQEVPTVKQIVDSETSAVPYIKEYSINGKLVDMHFKVHQYWFDLSVYIARKIVKNGQKSPKLAVMHNMLIVKKSNS